MAGLDPAIHDLTICKKDVDARHKAGHDEDHFCRNLPDSISFSFSTGQL
jgi:hypothetical protein